MDEAFAQLRHLRVSPDKVRLVVNQIRGQKVDQALLTLTYSKKQVAGAVKKTLLSAIANAENNLGLDVDTLVVSKAYVDGAGMLKRISPQSRGRAVRILKRLSHVTVAVAPKA